MGRFVARSLLSVAIVGGLSTMVAVAASAQPAPSAAPAASAAGTEERISRHPSLRSHVDTWELRGRR